MHGKTSKTARLGAVLVLSLTFVACDIAVDGHGGLGLELAGGKASDQWTRSYSLSAPGRLELINVNGRITAEATDGTDVEVRAERTTKAATDEGAKELLQRIEMREEASANRVRIEVRPPRMSGPAGHEFTWTVKVPRGLSADLRTVNGGVRLENLEGEVYARSTNGGIKGIGLRAEAVDASVVNGGVEIELAKAVTGGTFQLEAVNGGVSLNLPADSRADVTGRCTNGGISTSDLPLETIGEQSRRRLDARLNGGGARVTLETVNGGVRIGRAGSPTD